MTKDSTERHGERDAFEQSPDSESSARLKVDEINEPYQPFKSIWRHPRATARRVVADDHSSSCRLAGVSCRRWGGPQACGNMERWRLFAIGRDSSGCMRPRSFGRAFRPLDRIPPTETDWTLVGRQESAQTSLHCPGLERCAFRLRLGPMDPPTAPYRERSAYERNTSTGRENRNSTATADLDNRSCHHRACARSLGQCAHLQHNRGGAGFPLGVTRLTEHNRGQRRDRTRDHASTWRLGTDERTRNWHKERNS